MLPIIKEVKHKLRTARGFTMVELMVVLLILGILAALAGVGLTAYIRMARFEHNESNARTVFQTAQIALTRKDTSGDMDTFLTQLRDVGIHGGHFTADGLQEQYGDAAEEKAKEFNSQIYALYYDKSNPDSESSQMVRALLDPYVYDESLFNASIVVEVDSLSGQVYSAFCDTSSDKLRFAADSDADGAMLIDDRSYTHRRSDSLVGYYSAEDTVNVVALSQTRLKVKNPQLINNETLTLNWSGNSKMGDIDTIYDAEFYSAADGVRLFKLEIVWADVEPNRNAKIKVYRPTADNSGWQEGYDTYTFPLSYSKGRFILTLDAMCDANLLRAAENDDSNKASTKTTLFSITRLTDGAKDIYVEMKARPNVNFQDAYTESKKVRSNTENTLFAAGSTPTDATLKYFRHLYNLRWVKGGNYTFNNKSLVAANQNTTLDWTDGSVTVYCGVSTDSDPVAKVPSRTGEVVAWPTIPTIAKDVTLTGSTIGTGHVVISNLQLRSSSIAAKEWKYAGAATYKERDHYVGLVGENNGTLSNITLRDPDVQINAAVKASGEQNDSAMAMDANGSQYLQALAADDPDYRQQIWSVGALAGVDTGSLTNCTIDRSSRRGAEAKVTAALSFSSNTTSEKRVDGASIQDEPHGIGGLVGFAMPESGAKLTSLTLDQNVTVAGIFQDENAAENPGTAANTSADAAEKMRYNAIANEDATQTLWRAVGVGGVAGVLDATNLAGSQNVANLADITNKSTVVGNAFVGGITGNLYSTASGAGEDANTLTGLTNQGTVLAGANYQGSQAGESKVLGQFFGGIAGYARNLVLDNCSSATRSGLSETTLANLIQAGYTAGGALTETSPLKGDFVGGLVGFGRDIQMTDCYTESGYVLGRSFVGGFVGGFVGSDLYTKGGVNNSYVFGNRYVGGIVSVNGLNSTIENMTNKGLVAGLGADAAYVGGIAGVNDASWGVQDGTALPASAAAKLVDSANSMSTVEVTDKNKIALLQQLSKTKDGTAHYADFVGGVAGYNGTNGQITWQKDSDKGAALGAVLYGGSFVGGVAGYNDATAAITNEHSNIPSVTGTIVATGDCVGGVIGLNGAATLPAVQVSANRIEGIHFVGGVIGANLPAEKFAFVNASGTEGKATTIGTGRLVADGVAGGIIGYNRVVNADTLKNALAQNEKDAAAQTLGKNLQTLLPTFDGGNALTEPALTQNTTVSAITLTGLSNQFNIYANAYVGGIIGYNAADTTLTLVSASNGNARQAQSYGGLALGTPADAANGEAYILGSGVTLGELDPDHNGYFAGGILGYTTANTTLENCTNYGGVQHPVAAGGLTGVNDGTITGGIMQNSMGNQQEGYRYLGGIAGINNGKITNSAPAASSSIRGGVDIGGVAGYNGKTGAVTLENANGSVYGITATGGVVGYNLGNVTAQSVTVKVSGTTQTGGVAGFNAEGATIGGATNANATTIKNGTTVTSTNEGGGAAGTNYGTIRNVTNLAGSIQVVNQYAGGIAGRNYGRIENSNHGANGTSDKVLYTGGGYAGGITGCNEAGAALEGVGVYGRVTAANGEAGGVTAHNYGYIKTVYLIGADIRSTSDAIGGVAAVNERDGNAANNAQDALIEDVSLWKPRGSYGATVLYGPATHVGGLVGYNAGTVKTGSVEADSLDLSHLTASDSTVTAGGALGENTGRGEELKVSTNLTDSMAKYLNLGGVAGSSSGALVSCTYTGQIGTGTTAGFTTVGSTVGGIVGSNDVVYNTDGTPAATGSVKDCIVGYINLQVQGASNVGASQDAATKMNNAAHIGGIVGRNRGKIEGSTVGTDGSVKDLGTAGGIITARNGFVGGVAGSNSGTITTSGGKDTKELVEKINAWLEVPYKDVTTTDDNGTTVTTKVVDTDQQNANLNQMVRVLTGKASGEAETTLQTRFTAMKGFDTLTYGSKDYNKVYTKEGLGYNQLLVSLRGSTSHANGLADGYLGGITGFNDVSGQITNSASGQWFVYADNINQSWGAVGGIIGQNESNADSTSGLVNFAAVRRFVRGTQNTADDDNNFRNDRYVTTNGDRAADNYVGGVIGTQENRTGDRWTLDRCINIGTVFNSRSNNVGGVLAYWLSYGGTLRNCFNFGNLTTNSNNVRDSGTIGGIAGYFSQPIAGTAVNMVGCRNYGDINMMSNGANDIAGIFGKVQMRVPTDAMTINITDCVNAAKNMTAYSMASGIFAYIGPYQSVPNVEVNIDRCRNYCCNLNGLNNASITTGIFGNRGNPSMKTTKMTTITNCFSLYTYKSGKQAKRAITYSNNQSTITGWNNYYMDTVSFERGRKSDHKIDGMLDGLGRDASKATDPWKTDYSGFDLDRSETELTTVGAHRLYAGVDLGASEADGSNNYTYFAMLPKLRTDGSSQLNLSAVTGTQTYIKLFNGKSFSDPAAKRIIVAADHDPNRPLTEESMTSSNSYVGNGYAGQLLLLYNEADNTKGPTIDDIVDESLQNYYAYLLDTDKPAPPANVAVKRSDNDTTTYGRYEVSWDANTAATKVPASYYHVTVYLSNEDGTERGETLLETDVYSTNFTFEVQKEWSGKYYNVAVSGVNNKGIGTASTLIEDCLPARFAQTLPTPQLEVRLVRDPAGSTGPYAYRQMLTLVNAAEYAGIDGWRVDVQLITTVIKDDKVNEQIDSHGTTTFHDGYTEMDMQQYDCPNTKTQYLRAYAEATDAGWMRSARYNNSIYVPGIWDEESSWACVNPGLPSGKLTIAETKTDGSNMDELSISVKLSFAGLAEGNPVYRVMLLGKALNRTTITDKDGNTADLKGQYITLSAQERTISATEETITFADLPDDLLSDYEDWIVLAVPTNSGVGDAVTRWDATAEEAVAAIQNAQSGQPVAWYQGMEIVRKGNDYSYEHLTPLYFAVPKTGYTPTINWAKTANGDLGNSGKYFPDNNTYGARIYSKTNFLTVAQAPQLTDVPADGTLYENYDKSLLESDNQLAYTFTWVQPNDPTPGQTKYKLTLYGVTETKDADGNVLSTAEETITLPDDANSKVQYVNGTYSYTLNIDTGLAGGSNSWRFDKVRLRVTRDTTGTNQGIGAADTATYTVLRRLQQVGEPSQVYYVDTGNAEQVRYQISWPAVSDTRVHHYELYAQEQNADGTLGEAKLLTPADLDENGNVQLIYDTQTVVDLEAYQGKTLVFYVVACPDDADTSVLRSPNGEASAPQTIIHRTEAPAINSVDFTWTGKTLGDALPLMNSFCNDLTIQMQVDSANAASYFFTGYLFDSETDYNEACDKANAWMDDPTKANLDALNAALANGICMIPESSRTVGSETQADGSIVSYTVTPNANAFTMHPADANRYLLPALRAMVANSETETTSSSWKFYVPANYADEAGALHLPKIKLDKPKKDGIISLTSVESKVEGKLYSSGDEPWDPDSAEITIHQYAVQWPAVNEYTDTDGTTRNFAETYRFTVTPGADMPTDDPEDTNKDGYDIRFTVAPADTTVENDDGTTTEVNRGEILTVEKLPYGADEDDPAAWLDITAAARHIENAGTDNEVTWYDLSIVEIDEPVLDAEGNKTGETRKVQVSKPVTLKGRHAIDNDNPSYRIETVPTLRQAEMTDYSSGYLVTLPDLTQRADGDNDETRPLEKFTEKVTIWAVGDGEKTADSDRLEVSLRETSTQAMDEEPARSVVTMAEAAPRPTKITNRAGETPAGTPAPGDTPATSETAAPAA